LAGSGIGCRTEQYTTIPMPISYRKKMSLVPAVIQKPELPDGKALDTLYADNLIYI
jgi:hypothetical protein